MKNNKQNINRIIRIFVVFALLLTFFNSSPAKTSPTLFSDKKRTVKISVDYTLYEWWLLSWKTSEVVCQVYTEHESWPDYSEVLYFCGATIQKQWMQTNACLYSESVTQPEECQGLYLHLANVTPLQKEVEVNLPPAEVFISAVGCDQAPGQNNCTSLPYLRFQAYEPLPNETTIQIVGRMNGMGFSCPGGYCDLPLQPTGTDGVKIEFWAESSYGDSSDVFSAQVRVIPWGDFANPDSPSVDQPTYYVDVLSSQWVGEGKSSCSDIWQAFLPIDGPPAWLRTPQLAEQLETDRQYYLLAGMLIQQGLVDASHCQAAGLETNGAATVCGMEAAQPLVDQWQNQFNAEIIQVANQTGIPAQLMKNIFSRESQFWPGIYQKVSEAGLGHLSDLGADAVLLWNPSFYSQFCPLILTEETCQRGFGNLDIDQQKMLRGALVQKVNAACPGCPVGIDLTQANFSISIFARSLLANCEQVRQIIFNNIGKQPGQLISYEDLWKFSLVNYTSGAGCLGNAMQRTINNGNSLTWENVAYNLEPACRQAIEYVDEVSTMPVEEPPGVEDLMSDPTPEVPLVPTPTPQRIIYPTTAPYRTPTPYP
ncbi:MAG: hypothetical protein M0P11_05650 [Anaerolineaceae bacterium]|nr:hypothetical protein [Anaerolineaceae bacterium]